MQNYKITMRHGGNILHTGTYTARNGLEALEVALYQVNRKPEDAPYNCSQINIKEE